MSKHDEEFLIYVFSEVLRGIPGITQRRTIGGSYILYKDGVIFGLVADNGLYFKVDGVTKPKYEDAGASAFTYQNGNGDDVALSYYEVPDGVLENKELLRQWIDEACEATKRKKK